MAGKYRTQIPRPSTRKRKPSVRPLTPRPKGELERTAVRRLAAMKKIKHVSIRTAWDDVLAEFEGLRRETEITRGDAMAMENTRIDQLYSKALSLYSKGSVPAGRLALSIMGRRAKLNGLDAPTKIAPTDPTGEHTADTGSIDVNTLSEDTLRRVLRDEKREPLDVTRCR